MSHSNHLERIRLTGVSLLIHFSMVFAFSFCAQIHIFAQSQSANDSATFEWFEYLGKDKIFDKPLKRSEFQNPIIAGFYPDPSIVRVGSDYYMVHSTFGYYPGIPIFHSRDLVSWSQIGNVIDRPGMLNLTDMKIGNDGVYAPTIEFHDGTFYVANTCVRCGGNFVVTAKNPKGPWSDPIWMPEVGGIDPSLFFEDGRVYVLNNDGPDGEPEYEGHRAIWIREVDPVTFKSITKQKLIVNGGSNFADKPIWVEGPHVYKVNGWYYLSVAEGGTEINHSQVIFRSKNIFGPYEPNKKNPILTQRHLPRDRKNPINSTGHADMFQDSNGKWWAVFLATRTYDNDQFNTGRETFLLPVKWKDGWPTILKGKQKVSYRSKRPRLKSPRETRPTSGNFRAYYDFRNSGLGKNWMFIRVPKREWWSFDRKTGLMLQKRTERLGDMKQPSIIAHRVHHTSATFTTSLRFKPLNTSEEAGLIALQNDDYFYAFGVGTNAKNHTVLRLRHKRGKDYPRYGRILNEKALADLASPVELRIRIDGAKIHFEYRLDSKGEFSSFLDGADATTLSSKTAGGFVGATVGMFAQQ